MDRTESTVRKTLMAIEAPLYDIGVLGDRLFSTGFRYSSTRTPAARTSTSALRVSTASPRSTISTRPRLRGSRPTASPHVLLSRPAPATSKAWLKHSRVFPKLLGTFAAQTLAERYDADPSAAD
jgi:hypothetical protein